MSYYASLWVELHHKNRVVLTALKPLMEACQTGNDPQVEWETVRRTKAKYLSFTTQGEHVGYTCDPSSARGPARLEDFEAQAVGKIVEQMGIAAAFRPDPQDSDSQVLDLRKLTSLVKGLMILTHYEGDERLDAEELVIKDGAVTKKMVLCWRSAKLTPKGRR